MLDLILSVLCSSLIFVVFKLFDTYKVQTLFAIVTNYVVACVSGIVYNPNPYNISELPSEKWFYGTVGLGILFIVIFNVMAKSSQINGVGVTSVATKMSFVIPVIFAVFYYKDVLNTWQIIGVLLAIGAVYLTSLKKQGLQLKNGALWLPFVVFLGSGIIDTAIKFFQEDYLTDSEFAVFSSTVFGSAAMTGFIYIGVNSFKKPLKLNFRNILGGIALGIPNYFSIFFLLRALNSENLNTTSVFTINNVAIVLFSTLLGILLFKEKLILNNWLGVLLSVLSILMVALL
ncbi:DMT family transporter [Croceivirga thetidis]|uniref:DMT family transporter n=1 Tax=Croceivirga thetidis TaxID=2721623 RepID=A0ABX1GU68_9FLAO|nr:DMT family transporter [Croceivirga thetidis]NKI32571.1 DMT family transporter [Croceivirga thetidis]